MITSEMTGAKGTRRAATGALLVMLAACSSGEGGSVDAGATASARPSASAGAKLYTEVQQFGDVHIFGDYRNASARRDVAIAKGAEVLVRCVVTDGPVEAAPSANGKWYLLAGPGELKDNFAAANTFVNNSDLTKPLNEQNEVDPAILADNRICTPEDLSFLPKVPVPRES